MSSEPYDEVQDLRRGANLAFTVKEGGKVSLVKTEGYEPSRGPSAFAFVPGTEDKMILLLRTSESHPDASVATPPQTYISVMNTAGQIIMTERFVADTKF